MICAWNLKILEITPKNWNQISVSEKAWLGMVKPPWKRLDGALMMPDVVRMIKTEKVGAEYGVEMGGSGVWKGNMV